jgi:predicted nucleotidyltransferase
MILMVAERAAEIEALCQDYRVQRLELFGSAATGAFHPKDSDLDFLVEFQELPIGSYAEVYFGLLESLEGLFGRPVDLIVGSTIENPFFLQSVNQTKELLYAT